MQPASDHEVQGEKERFTGIVWIQDKDDAFAEAAQAANGLAFNGVDGRNCGAQKQWAGDAKLLERLADDTRCERG